MMIYIVSLNFQDASTNREAGEGYVSVRCGRHAASNQIQGQIEFRYYTIRLNEYKHYCLFAIFTIIQLYYLLFS